MGYVAAAGGVLHYLWLVKADRQDPVLYLAVLVTVLLLRLPALSRCLASIRRGPRAQMQLR